MIEYRKKTFNRDFYETCKGLLYIVKVGNNMQLYIGNIIFKDFILMKRRRG